MNADYRRKSAMARLQATHLLTEKAELQAELLDREKNVSEMSERMRERVSSSSGDASDSSQSQVSAHARCGDVAGERTPGTATSQVNARQVRRCEPRNRSFSTQIESRVISGNMF